MHPSLIMIAVSLSDYIFAHSANYSTIKELKRHDFFYLVNTNYMSLNRLSIRRYDDL